MRTKLLALFLLLASVFCGCASDEVYPEVSEKTTTRVENVYALDDFEGLIVSEPKIVDACLSFILKNESENTYITGYYQPLEYEVDGEWHPVVQLEMIDGAYIAYPSIAVCLDQNSEFNVSYDLYYYGATAWKDGIYRALIPFSLDGVDPHTWLEIPFAVSDGIPMMSLH